MSESIVRRFRVVGGKHHTGKGTIYRKGDVLESTRPLDKIYINKFVEVADASPVTASADPDGTPPQGLASQAFSEKHLLEARISSLEYTCELQNSEIAHLREELEVAQAGLAVSDVPPRLKKTTVKKGKAVTADTDPFNE